MGGLDLKNLKEANTAKFKTHFQGLSGETVKNQKKVNHDSLYSCQGWN